MKTLIKLLIAVLVLNALARSGMAASRYYRLKDAAEQVVLFGGGATVPALYKEILDKAVELEVPLAAADLMVTREGMHTIAHASYTEAIELFPRYRYPFTFAFDVEARVLNTVTEGPPPP